MTVRRQLRSLALDLASSVMVGDSSPNRPSSQRSVALLKLTVSLGVAPGERTPWAKTVRTGQQLHSVADGLWTFLEIEGIEPTNNNAEWALRQSVIQRKLSHGVQSRQSGICRRRLLKVTTAFR